MNSPKKLNYETRPIKFTERKMLLASLSKICNFFIGDYQYIGFGGISFTDFKLFHKELNIDSLISIEGGSFSKEKVEFNSPYSFIKIINDLSTNALKSIDLSGKNLVWLDYDGTLDNYMFQDIQLLFSKLPEGSIYMITCNRELKSKSEAREYTIAEFEDKFGNLSPFGIKPKDFSGTNNYKTIRKMLLNVIESTLKYRNSSEGSNLSFNQLFNLKYQENRGANMYTFGGVITGDGFDFQELDLSKFSFVSNKEIAYELKIPNLTIKEIELINKNFNDDDALLLKNIIGAKDLSEYKKTYRYLPKFFDVRL
jgi:Putative O-methyltransferase